MQAMLFEFLRRGLLDANLEHARALLRDRRDAVLEALDEHFGPRRELEPAEGATSRGSTCPTAPMRGSSSHRAAEEGVAVVKGTDFFPRGTGGESSLRLAFSFVSTDELAEGIARLARAVPAATPV